GAVLLLAMAVAATRPGTGAALVAMLGVAGFAAHLWWQLRSLDTASPDVCLRLFRSNRDAGLIVALFLAVAALV
ncbi:MAG: 4-hydroxybenzoate octaprenyltransferase, partial [Kocuria rhizophila]